MKNKTCCFCGKELTEEIEWNNPEPLNNERMAVCCLDCDKELVCAVRGVVWRPWVNIKTRDILIKYFKSLEVEQLKQILPPKELRMMLPQEWELYIMLLQTEGINV